MASRYYTDYSSYLARFFPCKMQKLTVNAGFSCPNRDGTLGTGGCIYCNNHSFSPAAAASGSIASQLEQAKGFFARKYPSMRYLAYFQTYTSTHAPLGLLMEQYREALAVDWVDGLVIGTRPDCLPDSLLDELKRIASHHYVMVELGVESSHDVTLNLVNRCHDWQSVVDAVKRLKDSGIHVGLHFIMGLPGEDEGMMLETVQRAVDLEPDVLKFHQLQLLRNTALEAMVLNGTMQLDFFELDDYLDLCCKIVDAVPRSIAIERFTASAPATMLLAPSWGIKNYEFVARLEHKLQERHNRTMV